MKNVILQNACYFFNCDSLYVLHYVCCCWVTWTAGMCACIVPVADFASNVLISPTALRRAIRKNWRQIFRLDLYIAIEKFGYFTGAQHMTSYFQIPGVVASMFSTHHCVENCCTVVFLPIKWSNIWSLSTHTNLEFDWVQIWFYHATPLVMCMPFLSVHALTGVRKVNRVLREHLATAVGGWYLNRRVSPPYCTTNVNTSQIDLALSNASAARPV